MESEFSLGCMIKEGVSLVIKTVMYHNLLAKLFPCFKRICSIPVTGTDICWSVTLYSYVHGI